MAVINAQASGAWHADAATVWPSGTLPAVDDEVHANGYTITIDDDAEVSKVSTLAAGGGAAGGGFALAPGVTLTADVENGPSHCVTWAGTTEETAQITGDVGGGLSNGNGYAAVLVGGSGELVIVGDVRGGNVGENSYGVLIGTGVFAPAVLTIVGDVFGSTKNGSHAVHAPNNSASWLTFTIVGNLTTGVTGTSMAARLYPSVTGSITGDCTAIGYYACYMASTSTLQVVMIVGDVTGGTAGFGVFLNGGRLYIAGTITASALWAGSAGSSSLISDGPFVNTNGRMASTNSLIYLAAGANPSSWTFQSAEDFGSVERTLYTADSVGGNPPIADVRLGTVFGPADELTGTCAVPPAASVAYGVPVDDGTGTAAITPESIRSECASALAAINLDHLMALACPSNDLTEAVADYSALAWLMATDGDKDAYDPTTDSLQGIGANVTDVESAVGTVDGVVDNIWGRVNANLDEKVSEAKLAADGLDAITVTRPSAKATTFPAMLVQLFYRFFGKATKSETQIKTYAADGVTVATTQEVSESGSTQTQGEAS